MLGESDGEQGGAGRGRRVLERRRTLSRTGFVVLMVGILALAPVVTVTAATVQSNAVDSKEAAGGGDLSAQNNGNAGGSGSGGGNGNGGGGGSPADAGRAGDSDGNGDDSSPGSSGNSAGNGANGSGDESGEESDDEAEGSDGKGNANGSDEANPGNENGEANGEDHPGKANGKAKANAEGENGHVDVSSHGTVVSRTVGNPAESNGNADPSVDFSVRNVTTGRPISLTFPNRSAGVGDDVPGAAEAEAEQSMSVDRLDVTVTNDSDFTMNVTTAAEPLNTTPAFEGVNGTESLAHMRVNHSVSDADIENVSFTFRLSRERLDEMETVPENVALYRYHGGEWTELPTEIRNVTATGVVFEALSPGLSEFAAGAKRPKFELNGATVSVEKIEEGDTIDVYVTVSNLGSAGGRFHADLILDDIIVDSRDVTVAAGGERRITFERALDRAGAYEVRINGLVAGEVTVEPAEASRNREAYADGESEPAATARSATATASLAALDRAGFGTASLVGVVLLLVLAVGAAFRYRSPRER